MRGNLIGNFQDEWAEKQAKKTALVKAAKPAGSRLDKRAERLEKRRWFQADLFFFTLRGSFGVSLAAHAYRFVNPQFSHDSLLINQNDCAWQITLGRFLQPVYLALRGSLCAPLLTGLLATTFLFLAVYTILRLLDISSKPVAFALCGLLETHASITYTHATYLPWSDVFLLALLFSTLAVWFFFRVYGGVWIAPVFLVLSLGLYQAHFQTALTLFLLCFLRDALAGKKAVPILLRGVLSILTLLTSLLLYAGVYQAVLWCTGVQPKAFYNSLLTVGDYTDVKILPLLLDTCLEPLRSLLHPETFQSLPAAILNGGFLVLFLVDTGMLFWQKKRPPGNGFLTLLLLVLLPPGSNAVYFISKGVEHDLMTFSFSFFYLLPALTLERWNKENFQPFQNMATKIGPILRKAALTGLFLLVFWNGIFSNQVYLKKSLQEQGTLSLMTRLLDRMEQTPGYVPGETPVLVIGRLDNGPLSTPRAGFSHISGVGSDYNFAVTYYDTFRWYCEEILGYTIQMAPQSVRNEQEKHPDPEIEAMPVFPAKGSVKMQKNRLVVRLS